MKIPKINQQKLKKPRNTQSMPDLTKVIQKRSFLPKVSNANMKSKRGSFQMSMPTQRSQLSDPDMSLQPPDEEPEFMNCSSLRGGLNPDSIKYFKESYPTKSK
mmetsp:Transcript_2143/g.2006  ORF Transcript_2143/g.2006 Transcript_2143/m.2006 type:complete len:103 (+) Transcript_2143:570-878(+)